MWKDLESAIARAKAANEINPLVPQLVFNSIETNLMDDERVLKFLPQRQVSPHLSIWKKPVTHMPGKDEWKKRRMGC